MDRTTQQAKEQAKQECITALEGSINATQKLYDIEVNGGLCNRELHLKYIKRIGGMRRELSILKGELPENEKAKAKYDEFGAKIHSEKKRPGTCQGCKKDFKNLNQHTCKH